jgi:Tol biopolymer transport system component
MAALAAVLILATACGARERAAETATANAGPPAAQSTAAAPAEAQPGTGLLKSLRVLISSEGGRVDWSTDNRLVYSRIKNLNGQGDLASEIYVNTPEGTDEVCLTCDKSQIPHLSNDQPAWHPGGDLILFQSADPNLSTNGISGAQAKRLVQGGFGYNNNLWVMSADGKAFTQLTHVTAAEASLHPHFSPDGSRVLWSGAEPKRGGGAGWALKLADFSTASGQPALSNIQSLTPLGQSGTQVYESHDMTADNSTVLYSYSAGQPLDLDIYKTNLATNQTTNLTNAPGVWDEHAHYSPDGKLIAWVSSKGLPFTLSDNWQQTLRTEVWIMNADGSNPRQATFFNTPGQPGATGSRVIMADLAWSPDGKSLIASRGVISGAQSQQQIVILDLNL